MSSIPLAALSVQPPQQPPNQLEQYARLLQIKNQMQEQPLRQQALQQQVQEGNVDLQQKQQALSDQKAMTAAMQGWDGKDYNDLIPLVTKNGGSAQAVIGLKSKLLEQQTAVANAFKANAEGTKAQVDDSKTKGDLLDGALSPLVDPKQVSDADLPNAIAQTAQSLTQKGILDPQHGQAATQLAQLAQQNPSQARQQLDTMRKGSLATSQVLEDALKQAQTSEANANAANARGKIDPNSPLYSPSDAAVNAGTAPLSSTIQAGKVQQAAKVAGAEESARLPGEMALARQRQALSQGDPNAAAQLLVNGDATLGELKARGATPEFIANTLTAAKKLSNGAYNAQSAEAQFDVAKSPANVAFFGSAKSLTDKGGTLDQLQEAAKKIPGGLIPAFNSIADWERAATGSGPIAKYASLALGVADDYSKVMGGGQGSDSSRAQALNLVGAKMSPEQRAASIEGIRGAVTSQTNSRIGDNAVLKRMYGGNGESVPRGTQQGGSSSGTIRARDENGKLHEAPAGTPLPKGWKMEQ